MDPGSAIGVASAVLAIANVIAKNVASLSDLKSRYNITDLKVSLMIGQLSTVKAALNQIADLLGTDLGTLRDPELIGDFSTSLGCVEAVVIVLQDRLSLVQRNASNGLTVGSKVNFIWDEKTMDDYLGLLNNQIHALGLLLTALQCRTAMEQSSLLQARESRHIFARVKDDTSSLLWLRDAESVNTYRSTGTEDLRTVTATFTFDSEIFTTKVYQTATRSNMIHALLLDRRDEPDGASCLSSTSLHSTSITSNPTAEYGNTVVAYCDPSDQKVESVTGVYILHSFEVITEDAPQTTRRSTSTTSISETIKGPSTNSRSSPTYSIESMAYKYHTIHTRETLRTPPTGSVFKYKPPPHTYMSDTLPSIAPKRAVPLNRKGDVSAYKQLLTFQRSRRGRITHPRKSAGTTVDRPRDLGVKVLVLGISNSGKTTLQKSMKIAFDRDDEQWRMSYGPDIRMSVQVEDKDVSRGDHTNYQVDPASQSAYTNCVPTPQEVLWANNRSVGLYESRYFIAGTLCRFFDVGGTRSERRKWPLAYADVSSIIFTLDVSCYDQVLAEDITANRMKEQFGVWDGLVRSKQLAATNFIVLFTKVDELTPAKLEMSPFNSLFPDYSGKADSPEDIIQYLARRLGAAPSIAWANRRVVFCNAGSIRYSPTSMAEVAVGALHEVEVEHFRFYNAEADTRSVRGKNITHVAGGSNSRNTFIQTGGLCGHQYQYPGRNPAAWARARGAAPGAGSAMAYHVADATLDGGGTEDEIHQQYGSLELECFSRGFYDALSQISEDDEEDLDLGESAPLWLQGRKQDKDLMWT